LLLAMALPGLYCSGLCRHVQGADLSIGTTANVPEIVTVSDPNAPLNVDNVFIGNPYQGTLLINNGATANTGNVYLGVDTAASAATTGDGSLLVTGPGSTLNVTGIGTPPPTILGTGTIFVTNGGTINMASSMPNNAQIALNGNTVFDSAFLNQGTGSLLNAGTGRIDFDHGSVVTSTGNLSAVQGIHVNDSVLNVSGKNGVLNIDGGLYLNSGSTVGITVGNTSGVNGKINIVNGPAVLGGTLLIHPENTYFGTAQKSYEIMNAPGASDPISGDFSNLRLTQNRFGTVGIDTANSDDTKLTILLNPSATPFSGIAQTRNERSVGQTFDAINQMQLPAFAPLMQYTWGLSDAQLLNLYNQYSGEIRAETLRLPLANVSQMAFDRVGWDSQYGHVFFGPQYRLAATKSRAATWFRPYYADDHVNGDGNASGYNLKSYGFTGGIDRTLVGGKTALGAMLGYGRPELDVNRDHADVDDFIVGAYLATRILNAIEMKAWAGYGYQYYDMTRQITYLGEAQSLKSSFKGNTGTGSAEIAMPIYTGTRLVLRPVVGYDYIYNEQKGADENGNNVVGLSYHKTSMRRHTGRAGLAAEYGNSAYSIYGGAQYKHLLGGDRFYASKASFQGGGPEFTVVGVDLGKSIISANLGVQINLSEDRTRLIFADYTVDFGKRNSHYQTATAGFQQAF